MMKEILTSAYFIVPVSIVAIVLAVILIKRSVKDLIRMNTEKSGLTGTGYVLDLIAGEFSHKNVLRDVKLIPMKVVSGSETPIKAMSDIIYVGKCGILLITVISDKGEFDNPKTGEWRERFKTSKDGIQIVSKINPFDATIPQLRIVSELLTDEGINGKCVKRLVVFTEQSASTVYSYPEIVKADRLIETIHKLNKKSQLSNAEIRVAIDTIYDYSEYLGKESSSSGNRGRSFNVG